MTKTVGIFDQTIERLKERLATLEGDFRIVPYTADGKYLVDGESKSPEEIDLDYLWLSPDLSLNGVIAPTFEMALKTRSIGVLQTFNAGLDHPVYAKIAEKGTRLCNSSAQAVAISEYLMAYALSSYHPLQERQQAQAQLEWKRTPFRELSGTKWVIFGFGPIGRNIAKRAKAFDADISVIRRSSEGSPDVSRVGGLKDAKSFMADADIVVLACSLNETTRGMADKSFFEAIKPGALLINIARGRLIDDAALIDALDQGILSKAVLDVFHTEPLPTDDPLWSHPKVELTAHTSFNGSGVRQRWDDLFFDTLPRYLRGEALPNEVAS